MPQEPASALSRAISGMTFTLEAGEFHLIGFPEPPVPADFEVLANPPAQVLREADETTILASAAASAAILLRHPRARIERDLAWIRFELPMAWDLVGFLALVAGEMARAGVPIGAVCGYSRDHLFVARRYLPQARKALENLFSGADPREARG